MNKKIHTYRHTFDKDFSIELTFDLTDDIPKIVSNRRFKNLEELSKYGDTYLKWLNVIISDLNKLATPAQLSNLSKEGLKMLDH